MGTGAGMSCRNVGLISQFFHIWKEKLTIRIFRGNMLASRSLSKIKHCAG